MKFYRYEELITTNGLLDYVRIHEYVFYLVRETPCGYWISTVKNYREEDEDKWFFSIYDRKRWVSKTSRKRFAYPTRKEAMFNFKARKHRQIQILKYRLINAKTALALANSGKTQGEVILDLTD